MPSNFTRKWALVEDGVVVLLEDAPHELGHPFGELDPDHRAIDVSGVVCYEGYVVDAKGNVAPRAGSKPFAPGESAYHDRMNPPALSTAAQMSLLHTGTPHPTVHPKETFPTLMPDD